MKIGQHPEWKDITDCGPCTRGWGLMHQYDTVVFFVRVTTGVPWWSAWGESNGNMPKEM
jgi:hypothetical protein